MYLNYTNIFDSKALLNMYEFGTFCLQIYHLATLQSPVFSGTSCTGTSRSPRRRCCRASPRRQRSPRSRTWTFAHLVDVSRISGISKQFRRRVERIRYSARNRAIRLKTHLFRGAGGGQFTEWKELKRCLVSSAEKKQQNSCEIQEVSAKVRSINTNWKFD
jgi:hypothetical protein